MKRIIYILLISHFSSLISISQSVTPYLTLNTEMHTAMIWHISTDASGKYILTCSYDKTAKLWNAKD
jgi:WD40 repeat protein